MGAMATAEVDRLLDEWSAGDREALEDLIPLVYDELRHVARKQFSSERRGHTLQTTALVNETYLKFRTWRRVHWESRAQFFAFAGQLMRRILVDHARERLTKKRGGDCARVHLDEALGFRCGAVDLDTVLDVDRVLRQIEKDDQRQGQVIEMRFFGGLTIEEVAEQLGVSTATVRREWTTAKQWLARELRTPS